MAVILLFLQYILITSFAKTKKAFINLKCDGTGSLLFNDNTVPITANKNFEYPQQITLTKDDIYKLKHSEQYNVDMPYAIGPIESNVYIHVGNMQQSSGCPHLSLKDAIKFYEFVSKSDEVELTINMAYINHPTLCRITDIITNIFEFKWFAKDENYGDDLNVDNAQNVMYDNMISMNHLNTENYEQTTPLMFMINVISIICICSILGAIVGIAFGCVSKVHT